ncbi:hypothetical protein [Pyxidicoccus xibeiensis]|uniref:hypothetical protein n=1 Tax=Pyxidicoccus xibeiensis TaxID=2906759 RepID=UPI0020A71BF0|nr:hypothetical protein [Pyxidicoccus xibeiensis]MCP3138193.1 hypothetical protein [Pyxidicoccus xibeiensis]
MPTKLTAALLALLCGCSTTATISRVDGSSIDAKIARSDSNSLFVKTGGGAEAVIPRAQVADIDHPGNGTAVFGGLLSAYGALNIVAGMETCGEQGGAYCVGTFLPAAIGVPMLIWGLTTWASSTSAAEGHDTPAHSGVVPSPPPSSPFDFSPPGDSRGVSALRTH